MQTNSKLHWIKKFIFPYSPKKFFSTTSFLIIFALMLSLRIILQQFTIPVTGFGFKISISWLPIYVVGFFFGPFIGIVFGAISDTLIYLINGGVWFWMYAIQEPIIGLISGILGSFFFLLKNNKISIWYIIWWRIIIYTFALFCIVIIFKNLHLISDKKFYGAKNTKNNQLLGILIVSMLFVYLLILELLNLFYYHKINKQNKNVDGYKLFLIISILVVINIMLLSFLLGPISQLKYLKYIGNPEPNGYIKYGVMYLLIPRILKECVKTPLYIILLFSIIYALKKQYENLINTARNKWSKNDNNRYNIYRLIKKNYLNIRYQHYQILYLMYHFNQPINTIQLEKYFNRNIRPLVQELISRDYITLLNINNRPYYLINKNWIIYS